MKKKHVFIIDALRTPIGAFGGQLKNVTTTVMGAVAIGALFKNNSLNPDFINEVIMGNVLSAGIGQAPARQAALKAGLNNATPSTTINKVCASGMKAVMLADLQIQTEDTGIMVAGGMESMSNVPYYAPDIRFGRKQGHTQLLDGIVYDGLTDAFKNHAMGKAAELCAKTHGFSRQDQDHYAISSYQRAITAQKEGAFDAEITPIKVRDRSGHAEVIDKDEEPGRFHFDKISKLSPVFEKEGTVTAANSSSISDGAAALLLASEKKTKEHGLSPIARIVSHSSFAQSPEWFTTSSVEAIKRALHRANKSITDMDLFEIHETFSVVPLTNIHLLGLDPENVNIHGGAVSLGHPIGCSGARILVTLLHALRRHNKTWGCAGICNGGGGASAMIVERLS